TITCLPEMSGIGGSGSHQSQATAVSLATGLATRRVSGLGGLASGSVSVGEPLGGDGGDAAERGESSNAGRIVVIGWGRSACAGRAWVGLAVGSTSLRTTPGATGFPPAVARAAAAVFVDGFGPRASGGGAAGGACPSVGSSALQIRQRFSPPRLANR